MGADKGKNEPCVLVIGGGVAGATAAERLGRAGIGVDLVEKQPDIGGHAADMGCKATDTCLRCNVCVADEIFRSARNATNVRLHTSALLQELQPGSNGKRFRAILSQSGTGKSGSVAVDADAVVVAAGYEPFDPVENSSYRYGGIPNVITGIEAERQLGEQSRITRPSDGEIPGRVAFIQCVGSRTEEACRRPEDTDYCSAVCCSYALRMGQRIKHQAPESDVTVFYMDIQNFGKGFDEFYSQCKDTMRFVRSRPYELHVGKDGAVVVKYTPESAEDEDGKSVCEEEFDLVVLSVGIRPPADAWGLSDLLGVPLDECGFFGLKNASAFPDLQKEGIYVVGACESPKDIAGSIAQAEAVSTAILADGVVKPARPAPADNLMNRPLDYVRPDTPKTRRKTVCGDVVVVGGGVAGMQAAVTMADMGHGVTLVHRGAELGGTASAMPELYAYLDGDAREASNGVRKTVADLAERVKANKRIQVRSGARVAAVDGEVGDFAVMIGANGNSEVQRAGAVVLACGSGLESAAGSVGGDVRNVVDMKQLAERIRAGDVPQRVAFVADVTCEHGRAVSGQVLSAAGILAGHFGSSVKVFCHSVRVAATGMEKLYRRARDAGVTFAKAEKKPQIRAKHKMVSISAEDPLAGVTVTEEFDLVAVADLRPSGNGQGTVRIANLKTGPEGLSQYDDVWLLTSLTSRPGVFVVGAARGNSEYRDALTDGFAAARSVHELLGAKRIEYRDDAAEVDSDKCVLCLTCVRICPHGAIRTDDEKRSASISEISCQRCGVCTAECPAQAITLPGFTDEQMAAEVGSKPHLTIFACENSGLPAAETAAASMKGRKVDLIRVPCAGKVDPRTVLGALENGADKVLVLGCHPDSCRYLRGAGRAERRTRRISEMLEKAGVDGSRVEFGGIASVEPQRFVEYVERGGSKG